MEHAETEQIQTPSVAAEAPNSLNAILDPAAALEAAHRMQRWYQTTPQGAAHTMFGRDGRRVQGRPGASVDEQDSTIDDASDDAEAQPA